MAAVAEIGMFYFIVMSFINLTRFLNWHSAKRVNGVMADVQDEGRVSSFWSGKFDKYVWIVNYDVNGETRTGKIIEKKDPQKDHIYSLGQRVVVCYKDTTPDVVTEDELGKMKKNLLIYPLSAVGCLALIIGLAFLASSL